MLVDLMEVFEGFLRKYLILNKPARKRSEILQVVGNLFLLQPGRQSYSLRI